MADPKPAPTLADLEREHGIPPEPYCGLTPAEMSRLVVASHAGPRRPGEPVGYRPNVSIEAKLAWLREEFGAEADVERLRLLEQFFSARVSAALALDWMLPAEAFDRAVADGLRRHFPELSADAMNVIAGNHSYSHAK